ncbi:hypothetical protein STRTUCAR8_08332, partial [Streptomyces turgidiscabies Car8]
PSLRERHHRRVPGAGRRQARDLGQQVAPGGQVGRGVRDTAQALARRPGGADLDLGRGRPLRHPAEVVRTRARDRAAGLAVRQSARLERPGQPGPAHVGQQRVGGHLGLQLGAHQRHQPEGALPGVVPGRVVQQNEPAVGQILLAVDDRRLQGVRERREALGRPRRLDLDLRPQPRGPQRVDGGPEGQRSRLPIPVPLLRVVHFASAVRQSSLCRSHAGKIKGNGASVRGQTPVERTTVR